MKKSIESSQTALTLFHFPKLSGGVGASSQPEGEFFFLETCQRRIWIGFADASQTETAKNAGLEIWQGVQAYELLLRITTGLESAVVGETDIFGQFKTAWQRFETLHGNASPSELHGTLRPWMHRLFEDTKAIRTEFLQGIGGQSYGSLVRMLLKPKAHDSVLIIGAGKAARSVLPYLLHVSKVRVFNRTLHKLPELLQHMQGKADFDASKIEILDSHEAELAAWQTSTHVIVCVPADPEKDEARRSAWQSGQALGQEKGRIVHLGCLRMESEFWNGDINLIGLEDLFDAQKHKDRAREAQIQKAYEACSFKARERITIAPALATA